MRRDTIKRIVYIDENVIMRPIILCYTASCLYAMGAPLTLAHHWEQAGQSLEQEVHSPFFPAVVSETVTPA